MNYKGCERKFDIKKYCAHVDRLVRDARARGAEPPRFGGAGAGGGAGGGGSGAAAAAGGGAKKGKK